MIILLLALLAFAIALTLAGLWLSPKKHPPPTEGYHMPLLWTRDVLLCAVRNTLLARTGE